MDRKSAQIGRLAPQHVPCTGAAAGIFDGRDRPGKPLAQERRKIGDVGIQGEGEPAPCPHDVAHDIRPLRPDALEPDRLAIAVEHGRDIDEINGRVMHFAVAARDQELHEAAQAEALGVDLAHDTGTLQ